jgi:putative hemolysin
MLFWNILFVLLLVAFNAFFVSVEFAVVTARRSRIELLAETGNSAARIVKTWLENPAARARLIAASQLGITIVNLALGVAGEKTFQVLLQPLFQDLNLPPSYQVLARLIAGLPLVLSLVIVTTLTVVMGEQVPKVATLHNPEKMALLAAQPMRLFSTVFKWFISILDWATRQVLSWVGIEMVGEHTLMYTVEEIKHILSESEEGGVIEPPEREMLDAIFDMGDLLTRQVMVPRTEIVAVEADTPLPNIINLISKSTYTKFPVYEDNLDQILGIVHVKDLLQAMQAEDCKNCIARSLVREAIYVPETIPVRNLLQKFRANRQHIAIVLDEYGGTAGLVTLEDLLEEIVGEVSDPFDVVTPQIQTMPDGTILVDGLTLIEEVNNHLGLHLEDPDYDTIAGYVLGRLGRIPRAKEYVDSDGIRLQIEAMDGLRIARLRLTRLDKTVGPQETAK